VNKVEIEIDGKNKGIITSIGGVKKELLDLDRMAGGLSKSFGPLGDIFSSKIFSTAAITGAVTALGYLIKQSIDTADEMGKMAQKIGISVESLSTLKYAADLSDVSMEELQKGITYLNRAMYDLATGSKEQKRVFDQLGVSALDSTGVLRNTEDVLLDIADRFLGMESGAQKTALAMKIFGRSGAELIPFLNEGKKGIEELQQEARNLGIEISSTFARQSEEFNDNLTTLNYVATGLGNQLAISLMPALLDASTLITILASNTSTLSVFFSIVSTWAKVFATSLTAIYSIAGAVVGALRDLFGGTNDKMIGAFDQGLETIKSIWGEAEKYEDVLARIKAQMEALKDQAAIERLGEQWQNVSRTLRNDILAAGMNPWQEKLFQIAVKTEDLKLKYGGISGALQLINAHYDAMIVKAMQFNEISARPIAQPEPVKDQKFDVQPIPDAQMEQLRVRFEEQHALEMELTTLQAAEYAIREGMFGDMLYNMGSAFQDFANLSGTTNKTLFAIHKAFAIGEAGISTYLAATKALAEVPFPFNFVAAASVLAAGLGNVARIAAMQPGGGAAGGSPSPPALPRESISNISNTTNNNSSRQIIINVYGFLGADKDAIARDLIPAIEKAYGDGAGGG